MAPPTHRLPFAELTVAALAALAGVTCAAPAARGGGDGPADEGASARSTSGSDARERSEALPPTVPDELGDPSNEIANALEATGGAGASGHTTDDGGALGRPVSIHDPSDRALASFHAALRETAAGRGTTRILFYGASHVAADTFPGVVREELSRRFGDGGHGLVLPAKPWRHYRHRGVEVESSSFRHWEGLRIRATSTEMDHFGLAGVAVETSRAGAWGAVSTATTGDVGRTASRFEVYYLAQPGGGDFDVYIDGRRQERVRTVADARGPGYATFVVSDAQHRFEVRVRGNGPVRIFGVIAERDVPGVVVENLGINGARARYHLLWDEAIFREHLARRDPDLVVLAYGTNEVGDDDEPIETYEASLRQVVQRVRDTVPNASCLLIGPSDRPLREGAEILDRPRTREVIAVQRRVSEQLGCGFFDLVDVMGGPMAMVEWVAHDPPLGASDYVHLTRAGYERVGHILLGALVAGYGELPPAPAAPAVLAEHRDATGL